MTKSDKQETTYYVISVVAQLTGLHSQTLRYYERAGIVAPTRSKGNIRMYSPADIERIKQIRTLIDDLGVNLAGVEVVMRMSERMKEMQRRIEELESEVKRLREGEAEY